MRLWPIPKTSDQSGKRSARSTGFKVLTLFVRLAWTVSVIAAQTLAAATPASKALVIAPDKPATKLHRPIAGAKLDAIQIATAFASLPDVGKTTTMTSEAVTELQPKKINILAQLRTSRKMLPNQTFYVAIVGGSVDSRGEFCLATADEPLTFKEIGKELSGSPARIFLVIEVCRDLKSTITPTMMFPDWTSRRICTIWSVKNGLETAYGIKSTSPFADAISVGFSPRALPFEESALSEEQSVTVDRVAKRVRTAMAVNGQNPDIAMTDEMRNENLFFANAATFVGQSLYLDALVEFWKGNPRLAEQITRAALAKAPDSPKLLNLLGLILSAQGRYQEALDAYGAAVNWTDQNGVNHRREEVVRSWPIIPSNAAMAFWRLNLQLGTAAPKGWEVECDYRFNEGIDAEGGRSAYSWSNYGRFCEVTLKDVNKAEATYDRARAVGPDNATAMWNSAAFAKERYKALKESDTLRANEYLKKAIRWLNTAIDNPDLERQVAIGTGAAIILWKFDAEIKALNIPNRVDYRALIDEVVRKAKRPSERAAALDAFETIRAKDFDEAISSVTAIIASGQSLPRRHSGFELIQLTAKLRPEAALDRVRRGEAAKVPFSKRESLMPLVAVTAAMVQLSNLGEARKTPVPSTRDERTASSWGQIRALAYASFVQVLEDAMAASDFSSSGFVDTSEWKVVAEFATHQGEKVKDCIERARVRGPAGRGDEQ